MSIIRVVKDKNNPYLIMNKTCINDPRLSLKAKGLLVYLLSKPDNWYVNTKDISRHSSNGIKSVWSAINELVHFGYMYKHQFRSDNGRYGNYNYIVFEDPSKSSPVKYAPLPNRPFRSSVMSCPDNDAQLNIDIKINNNLSNNKDLSDTNIENVVKDDPSIEDLKEYTRVQLYELGIKDPDKLFDIFPVSDIFTYADWMSTFINKVKNPTGFLITALREKWTEPERHLKSELPD